MPLIIIQSDITQVRADAIVNAANNRLQRGGGVCGAIFAAAGEKRLQKACDEIGSCATGDAVITPGFGLPASFIIHTVGPVWRGGCQHEEQLLRQCYRRSLTLAVRHELESIAFPLISSGIYGYPKDKALAVAVKAISEFLKDHELTVYLVFYDRGAFELPASRFEEIQRYLDAENYNLDDSQRQLLLRDAQSFLAVFNEKSIAASHMEPSGLQFELDDSFAEVLLRLIDERGKSDAEVYRKANLDRRHFSKIRSDKHYQPGRQTVLALAIALELSIVETEDLLARAGFALSRSSAADTIVRFFIEKHNYNIHEINEALFAFEQPTLGA